MERNTNFDVDVTQTATTRKNEIEPTKTTTKWTARSQNMEPPNYDDR